jgi:hypothetical protein
VYCDLVDEPRIRHLRTSGGGSGTFERDVAENAVQKLVGRIYLSQPKVHMEQ